jgi:hypothetical protein
LDAIGHRLFEIVMRTRDKVVMGPASDPAEARFRAGVTRYFMAVAWISADAELARHKLAGDKPKAFMSAFLEKMYSELQRVQIAIQPSCTDGEIWRMLFDDADLYSQVWNEAASQQCEDLTLAAGLRWFDERSLVNLASAEAYGECIAVLTIGAAITPQIVSVVETMRIDGTG